MLYEYQQKNVGVLNFDLKDLEFKILTVERVDEVKAADSARYFKKEFAKYWQKNPDETLIDTLSFGYVKNILDKSIEQQDTLIKLYQEGVLVGIKVRDYSYEYESERKRDKAMDEKYSLKETLSEIKMLEYQYNKHASNPDSVLSTKYRARYSMLNPLISDIRQTFDAYFYTDNTQSKFVKEEAVE